MWGSKIAFTAVGGPFGQKKKQTMLPFNSGAVHVQTNIQTKR